ncbi:hypothetical protein [Chlamydiifrater volucris]|uniref:hypothetical protein n=1 Tax=Chlamydiifrater volucris TaxID=2681470 RepID=UPI001BCA712D|nr:hypothetical protein [Chlamydiifrater volucris]
MSSTESIEQFFREIDRGEVPHAILFHGSSLEYLQSTAYNCASRIILRDCPEAKIKLERSIHPDIQEYGGNNRPSNLSIDIVREIKRDIWIKPFEAKKKIFVLHSIDSMSVPAITAFLKTLEEPPLHAVIILTTVKKYSLLPSVVSRTRSIRVPCKEYNHLNSEEKKFLLAFASGTLKLIDIASFFQEKPKGDSSIPKSGNNADIGKLSEKKLIRGLLDLFRSKVFHQFGIPGDTSCYKNEELLNVPILPLHEVIETLQTAMDRLLLGSNKAFCFEWIFLQLERLKQKNLT